MLYVLGRTGEHSFDVLIDSGASHNFMSRAEAKRLGLTLRQGPHVRVKLADGTTISSAESVVVLL